MTPVSRRRTFAFALLLPCIASLWLTALPGTAATLSYVVAATLLTAMGGIIATMWRSDAGTLTPLPHVARSVSSPSSRKGTLGV